MRDPGRPPPLSHSEPDDSAPLVPSKEGGRREGVGRGAPGSPGPFLPSSAQACSRGPGCCPRASGMPQRELEVLTHVIMGPPLMPTQFLGRREMGEEHRLRGWGRVGGLREKGVG